MARGSRLYVLCGNAAYNRGDRGNLSAQLDLLQRSIPGAEITCDSFRAAVDRDWYPAHVVQRGMFLSKDQVTGLARADVVVWGGGALLADNAARTLVPYWLGIIGFVKRVLRKPIMAWAQGLVLQTRLGRLLAREALQMTDLITVRDRNSWETLQRLGPLNVPAEQTADPAILIEPADARRGAEMLRSLGARPGEEPIFAVTPTFWPFYHRPSDVVPYFHSARVPFRRTHDQEQGERIEAFLTALARVCDGLVTEHGARVIVVPRYPVPPWKDVPLLQSMRHRARNRERIVVVEQDDRPPRDFLAMYRLFDLVLSTALHDSIFATALEVPCVQLHYEPKGRDLFLELDAGDRLADWEVLFQPGGVDEVLAMVRRTRTRWPELRARMAPHRARLREGAHRNVELLAELVERRRR